MGTGLEDVAMMNKTLGAKLLLEVGSVLDSLVSRWFLMCGTALGAWRDRGFTPCEDDIDLGLLVEDFVPAAPTLAARLTKVGYELTTLVRPFRKCFAVKARKQDVGIDIVSYILWQDQDWGDDNVRFSPSTWQPFSAVYPKGLLEAHREVQMFGRTFLIPGDIEKYLHLEYGPDWMVPAGTHAYAEGISSTRVEHFLQTRGVPDTLLDRFMT